MVINGKKVAVDYCLVKTLEVLENRGLITVSSCCGHGIYPKTILIKLKNGTVYDYFTNIIIPRKARFYKKDKKGFYFIPETLKKLNDAVPCELKVKIHSHPRDSTRKLDMRVKGFKHKNYQR